MNRTTSDCLLLLILFFVATPWLFSAYLTWRSGEMLQGATRVMNEQLDNQEAGIANLNNNLANGGIIGKPDAAEVRSRYKQLRSYSALPDQIRRANSLVNLVLLDLDADDGWNIPVGVDVSEFANSAMVIMTNASIKLNVTGAKSGLRGKIGFESPLPSDMSGLTHGLLVGLKVSRKGEPVIKSSYTDELELARFCVNVKNWQKLFGVSPTNMKLWFVSRANTNVKISSNRGELMVSGGQGSIRRLGNFHSRCRQFTGLFDN